MKTDAKDTILIVEDEINISNFIGTILTANGYAVKKAATAKQAMQEIIDASSLRAIILDLGLPDMDGLKVIKSVREWSDIPIVVVSARANEKDKVAALDMGADDYLTKPFGTSELLARIRTALRHSAGSSTANQNNRFVLDELTIDYQKHKVTLRGEEVRFTQNEFKLIAILSQHAGQVLTYDYLLKNIWGAGATDNQGLRVHMANIRRKIEELPAEPKYIFTEMGVGYRMREPE